MTDFVHLHLHSQYSLLDGANRLDDVIQAAAAAGMKAISLTDHGNLFGAIEFYDKAKKAGIKPIIGIEAYVAQGSLADRNPARGSSNHLVLLARNQTGYQNLIKLTTRSYLQGFYYKPRIDHETLREFSDGLIGLSACLKGEINERILSNREAEAEARAREYAEILGPENFFLELQDHGIPEQRAANEVLRRMSKKLGLGLVVTNDCHYLHQSDSVAHDVLLCIGTQRARSDPDRLKYASDQFYLKSGDELAALFPDDGAGDREHGGDRRTLQRRDPVRESSTCRPSPCRRGSRSTASSSIGRWRAWRSASRRWRAAGRSIPGTRWTSIASVSSSRSAVIKRMRFPGYFMIVWDFIRFARESGIPVGPGRGSAAGSLVSFALRITDIDPMRYDLLFERFLNPDRVSMPDIDIDFCMRRRGEVIQYVNEKYGRDRVAQIITFGTLAAKGVLRDVGRVLGLPFAKMDRVAKLLPDMTKSLAEAARSVDSLAAEVAKDPEIKEVVDIGSRLEGLTRHASVHAAGVVIAPVPLDELVPLYKTSRDEITTQWDMKAVERLGLLKMDFLGLKTVTVVDDTLRTLKMQGIDLDLDAVPLDDPEVFRLFCDGRTNGIFQFESSGMRDMLRRAQPSRFEELAAFNALYRPGALSVGMVEEFIQRKLGKKKVQYILPETKPILEETFGVIAYQEQVMQVAVAIGGFTMGEADVLRKAMGKKDPVAMAKQKEKFVSGAADARLREEEGGRALGVHRALRRLRLQQEPQRRLRDARLQDRLPEGALSGGVHGGDALLRDGRDRRDRQVHQREPGDGDSDPAARRQRERVDLLGRRRRDPLRPRRHQGRRRERRRGDARRAPDAGELQEPRPPAAGGRRPGRQPEGLRRAREVGRLRLAGRAPGGARRRDRRPRRAGRSAAGGRSRPGRAICSVREARAPCPASRHRQCPPGRRASACGWRRKRSASTSRAIRWSSSRATSSAWSATPRISCAAASRAPPRSADW